MQHKDNIWINGCFDVLHTGHIKLFRRARQMGMRVIVGVDTDERIRQAKGENRPVNDLHNRIDFLRSIKYIDMIHSFATDEELSNIIKDYLPRYMLIGDDYKDKAFTGDDLGIPIHYLDRSHGWSTTKFKKLIADTI